MSSIRAAQAVGSRFRVRKLHITLSAVSLALLGSSQVQAAPSANGAAHAITGMAHANYHATQNCGSGTYVMTPQPGTDLMPVDVTTPLGVESIYARAARQGVKWLDTLV
jgi:hypothetical protein